MHFRIARRPGTTTRRRRIVVAAAVTLVATSAAYGGVGASAGFPFAGKDAARGPRAGSHAAERTEHGHHDEAVPASSTTSLAPATTAAASGKDASGLAAKATSSTTSSSTTAPRTTQAPRVAAVNSPTTTAAPTTTVRPSTPTTSGPTLPAGPTLDVRSQGATPDDGTDDQDALQAAFDAATPGTTIVVPPGDYRHRSILRLDTDNVTLWGYGATLTGTDPTNGALIIQGRNVTVAGITLVNSPTQRMTAEPQTGISLHYSDGTTVRDSTVRGSASAGIFVWGSSNYKILNNTVENTRSDGIHSVGGSNNGLVEGNTLRNIGDDCFAVISYISSRLISSHITIRNNSCTNGKARGLSVVGGDDVLLEGNTIVGSAAAGVYLASEPSYNTYAATRVRVIGNHLVGVNTNSALRHGGIFIWGRSGSATTADGVSHPLQNSDLTIADNTIENTVNGAANIVAQGSDSLRVNLLRNRTIGGKHAYLELNANQYNEVGEVHDDAPVADHVGVPSILP